MTLSSLLLTCAPDHRQAGPDGRGTDDIDKAKSMVDQAGRILGQHLQPGIEAKGVTDIKPGPEHVRACVGAACQGEDRDIDTVRASTGMPVNDDTADRLSVAGDDAEHRVSMAGPVAVNLCRGLHLE